MSPAAHEDPAVRALGRALRRARSDTGLSIEAFGNAHEGLSWRYVAQMERGQVNPGWLAVSRVVAACGLTMRQFGRLYDEELAREPQS